MKRFLALLMASMLIFVCCACSSGSAETKDAESVEDKVESAVNARAQTEIIMKYETTGAATVTKNITGNDGNTYYVSGKVSVKDKYGDPNSGKYDAVVEYDPEEDECDVTAFDLGTLYKD